MTQSPPDPLGPTKEQRLQSDISEDLAPMFADAVATMLPEAVAYADRVASFELPKRRPGTHWTGPSGRHAEVPITPRTLANIQRWGRTIR